MAKRVYAVLTGDLIKSRHLSAAGMRGARAGVSQAASVLASWDRTLVAAAPEFFRGDSWQMALSDATQALRAALLVRATLRAHHRADTRIAIGIGSVTALDKSRTSMSNGPAFQESGRALDEMPVKTTMMLALAGVPEAEIWSVVVQFCGVAAARWKPRQAELVSIALRPGSPTQKEIGKSADPPVSQQAVQAGLAGANWAPVEASVRNFEIWIEQSKRLVL